MKKFIPSLAKIFLLSFLFVTVVPVAVPMMSSDSLAQASSSVRTISDNYDNNILVGTMCNVMKLVTGKAGKAFAAFAIISVGIGFFTGKVSWGLMIGVAAGIAAIFGAPSIVAAISGSNAFECI